MIKPYFPQNSVVKRFAAKHTAQMNPVSADILLPCLSVAMDGTGVMDFAKLPSSALTWDDEAAIKQVLAKNPQFDFAPFTKEQIEQAKVGTIVWSFQDEVVSFLGGPSTTKGQLRDRYAVWDKNYNAETGEESVGGNDEDDWEA